MDIEKLRILDEINRKEQENVYHIIKIKPIAELSHREVDVLIDRFIMNNSPSVNIHSKLPTSDYSPPNYSTDLNEAIKVIRNLKTKHVFFEIDTLSFTIKAYAIKPEEEEPFYTKSYITADYLDLEKLTDVPYKICLIALRVIDSDT